MLHWLLRVAQKLNSRFPDYQVFYKLLSIRINQDQAQKSQCCHSAYRHNYAGDPCRPQGSLKLWL